MKCRRFLALIAVFSALVAVADYNEFERPPVVRFNTSKKPGYASDICHAQCGYGHDVRLANISKFQSTPKGAAFNGVDEIAVFDIPWLYPNWPLSATIVADVTIDKLPQKRGVIAGRRGYDNSIGVTSEGRIFFNCFSRDDKAMEIISPAPLKLGKAYRIAGVLDCTQDNRTRMTLWINGDQVAERNYDKQPRNYMEDGSRQFFLGAIQRFNDGSLRNPCACTVHEAYLFFKNLTRTEICQLAGDIDKSGWNAFRPLVEFGKTAPAKELTADGIQALTYEKKGTNPKSMTIETTFKLNHFPAHTGLVAGRAGFDNAIFVMKDGTISLTVWNEFKNELRINSTTRVKIGETHKVVAVMHHRNVEVVASLYVDGKLEAQNAISGGIFPYSNNFCIRGVITNNGVRLPLDCDILECRAYGIAIHPEQVTFFK